MPERVRLRRTAGWRLPANAVRVDRTTRWGNPFVVSPRSPVGALIDERRGYFAAASPEHAVAAYRNWLLRTEEGAAVMHAARQHLRGLDLACWCEPGQPCHADVLLEVANR